MRGIGKVALLMLGVGACHPGVNGSAIPAAPPVPNVSVGQVLTTQALVGERVTVTGTCLAPGSAAVAQGSAPHSGSSWQLEQAGYAIWVNGSVPAGCNRGNAVAAAITGRVVQDSLPRLSAPRTIRRYLVAR